MIKIIHKLLSKNSIRILDGFAYEEMVELLTLGEMREFLFRDIITRERRSDSYVYIILSGEVSLWKRNVPIFSLREGEVFNIARVFQPSGGVMTAIAESKTKVLQIKREKLMAFFARKPERLLKVFTLNAILLLLKNLEECEEQLISLYFQSMHMMEDVNESR